MQIWLAWVACWTGIFIAQEVTSRIEKLGKFVSGMVLMSMDTDSMDDVYNGKYRWKNIWMESKLILALTIIIYPNLTLVYNP